MDGLMSEATDLVLSSGPVVDLTTGPNMMLDRDTEKNSAEVSSVVLLRWSITNYLKDRSIQKVAEIEPAKQHKGRRQRGSSLRKPKVDIKLLDSEEDSLHVQVSAYPDNKISPNDNAKEQNECKDLGSTTPISESPNADEELGPWFFKTKESETKDGNIVNDNDRTDAERATRKKIAENGLKLASRKFSDGIFENCSTYGLACPEVLQQRGHCCTQSLKQDWLMEEKLSPAGESPTKAVTDKPYPVEESIGINDHQKSSSNCSSGGSVMDDQVYLSDSFFVNVVNGDCDAVKKSVSLRGSSECLTGSKKSSRVSLSTGENEVPNSEVGTSESNGRPDVKSEWRLSKKLRKRRKKGKSKDAPTYECQKCGVSYILSPNASDNTARCLHCDFWTSVEPVFLKREKQAWNTCRIC